MTEVTTTATLKFPSLELAAKFGTEWSRFTLEGRDRSAVAEDGSVTVKVYHVSDDRKAWIEDWIELNKN